MYGMFFVQCALVTYSAFFWGLSNYEEKYDRNPFEVNNSRIMAIMLLATALLPYIFPDAI